MSKVRVGIIGCGAIARYTHLHGYSRDARVEVAALADIYDKNLNLIGEMFDVSENDRYSDYRELLARSDIDAVSVCTPNYLHAEQTIAALEAGKHVLCEKPMAVTLAEADAMIEAAERSGKVLMVGFTHRYMKYNQRARDILSAGDIGEPFMIKVRFAHDGPYKSWAATTDWFFRPEQARGGALLDMGIHALDISRYFMGDIQAVSGMIGTYVKDIAVEDTAVIQMEFAHGLGYIETGWSSKLGPLGIEIYGSKGTIVVDYTTPLRVYRETDDPTTTGWYEPVNVSNDAAVDELRHFIDCVVTGSDPLTGAQDGKASLKAALAVYESAKTGRKVNL